MLSMTSPASVPGPAAAVLDRGAFDRQVPLVALRIPAKMCTLYMNNLRAHLFQRPRMKRILDAPDGNSEQRLLLLSETLTKFAELPPDLQQFVRDNGPGVPETFSLKLGYEHLSVEEVLRAILPKGTAEIPSSYEQAGHIAHLNLRDEMLPFKHLVGQVILDKNPALRTVVNKMGNIENEFRTFPMEVLAGDDDLQVTMRESGARFSFNFRNVYWNSRLQTEHARLIHLLKQQNEGGAKAVVADMMAGVGPFAVPLAMGNVTVHANDLNPESYASLVQNAKTNHCGASLQPYNQDARDFIIGLVKSGVRFTEAIMNLPANATDFLDVFIGLAKRGSSMSDTLPRIHVYAFSVSPDPVADVVDRVATVLRCPVEALGYSAEAFAAAKTPSEVDALRCWGHIVRDVSPKKMMVCLTFRLPQQVADAEIVVVGNRGEGEKRPGESTEGESSKRVKV